MNDHRLTITAENILGNSDYQAISYGGYRTNTRDDQPTIDELKEDMLLLAAMDIKLLRTYNTHFAQATNLLEAIRQLNQEDDDFEMYVMLGAWINCKGAFTAEPDHSLEDELANKQEINRAVELQKKYPEIVKIIAVGNEAMVHWATSYYVEPGVILKWVNYLQNLKKEGELSKDLWITSSDNFASWGGGSADYHNPDLEKLVQAVDFISMHTYPMHDTHYQPAFWGVEADEQSLDRKEQIRLAMDRALNYAQMQFQSTSDYIHSIDKTKPIHIGETGWASFSAGKYGIDGSKACDEYKEALYYKAMRNWTNNDNIACFYFEAFDESWKDALNPGGSENHFGLFTIDGKAKYVLWEQVDKGVFKSLGRNGNPVTKTYNGDLDKLMEDVANPPLKKELLDEEE
jgi:exo-beta-1,3-glucanase (GH17 family)